MELSDYMKKDVIDLEEELIEKQEKKHKKHYLNPNSKSFVNKFLKIIRRD